VKEIRMVAERSEEMKSIMEGRQRWAEKAKPDELPKRYTSSGIEYQPIYTPADIASQDYLRELGFPGEYPYTRGIYPLMYRQQPPITRQYAGFGTPEETNQRFKYLFAEGNTGLNIALDLPTQMGFDSDEPEYSDEVGRVGVAIDSFEDIEILFKDLPLDHINAAFTVNATAPMILAMFKALADKQGVPGEKLSGNIQNDNLKEYISRGAFVFPVKPMMKITTDVVEWCSKEMPRFSPISVCGYHIRESGCNAAEEIAFAFLIATAYIEHALERGLDIDAFAPRISFNLGNTMNFFEEIAKFRAARRLWARIIRERFGARNPRSLQFRFMAASMGGTYSWAEPDNNIVRGTIECLSAILGGTNACGVHTKDEGHTIPSPETQRTALRTFQLIVYESDVANVVDPLGGSYLVESMTNAMEEKIKGVMADIESRGGIIQCIENGYIQSLLAKRAYEETVRLQTGEKVKIGENLFRMVEEEPSIKFHEVDPRWVEKKIESLQRLRARRDRKMVDRAMENLRSAVKSEQNIMPPLVEAARSYVTIGEMVSVFKETFGVFREPVAIF
jgi:methylmalonyl-CoA mutase N-terminal domain/subunit